MFNDRFAELYELFFYSVPFSDDLYEQELYSPLGICVLLIGLTFVILFYYLINRPSFSRWYHWVVILLANFVIAFVIGFILPYNKFEAMGLEYESEYYTFALFNALIATIVFILFSYTLRWWSTNAKQTPIPH